MTMTRPLMIALATTMLLVGCEKQTTPAPATAPVADAQAVKVECLPCGGHEFKLTDRTVRTEHGGDTYYFCSEGCKEKFLAEPAKYVKAPATAPATQAD